MKKLLFILLFPLIVFGQKETIIHITTDAWPNETRWVLHVDSIYGPILGQVNYGYYTQANTSYMDTLYIPDSLTNISFVIYDSYGDGIQSPGSYFVSICGDTIVNYSNPSFTTAFQDSFHHNDTFRQWSLNVIVHYKHTVPDAVLKQP